MYSKKMLLLIVFLFMSFVSVNIHTNDADALSRTQRRNAERIAKYTASHYDKYGVLPSIAVAQAMQESSLGKHCPNYNMWGLASGKIYCSSVENGCRKYLKVINNGCYKGAPFCKSWRTQIKRILRGGYCQPVGSYYSCVVSIVNRYNLTKYDKKMWKDRKAKKEAKRRLKEKRRKQRLTKKKAAEAKRKAQELKKQQASKVTNPIPTLPPVTNIPVTTSNIENNTNMSILNNTQTENTESVQHTYDYIPLRFDVRTNNIIIPLTQKTESLLYQEYDFIENNKIYYK